MNASVPILDQGLRIGGAVQCRPVVQSVSCATRTPSAARGCRIDDSACDLARQRQTACDLSIGPSIQVCAWGGTAICSSPGLPVGGDSTRMQRLPRMPHVFKGSYYPVPTLVMIIA